MITVVLLLLFFVVGKGETQSLAHIDDLVIGDEVPVPEAVHDIIKDIGNLSAWTGHGPFASWLISIVRPKVVVDLGVDFGFSTLVFGAAMTDFDVPSSKVYGIDSFEFYTETGVYRDSYEYVQQLVHKYNLNERVEIIRDDFYRAAASWNKGTIDILHIDGLHGYDDVRKDYLTWHKFVHSETGVILFHDVTVSRPEFGVKRFFEELPAFDFEFKGHFTDWHGLGVLTNNRQLFENIKSTFPARFVDDTVKRDFKADSRTAPIGKTYSTQHTQASPAKSRESILKTMSVQLMARFSDPRGQSGEGIDANWNDLIAQIVSAKDASDDDIRSLKKQVREFLSCGSTAVC